jgi:hypothetical protein
MKRRASSNSLALQSNVDCTDAAFAAVNQNLAGVYPSSLLTFAIIWLQISFAIWHIPIALFTLAYKSLHFRYI